jgi:hypothetical protein
LHDERKYKRSSISGNLLASYESEQGEHAEKVEFLKRELSKSDSEVQDIMRFFDIARKHDYVTELTKEVVHKFLDNVVVHQADGIGRTKNKTQKVEVKFRFIKDNWFIF